MGFIDLVKGYWLYVLSLFIPMIIPVWGNAVVVPQILALFSKVWFISLISIAITFVWIFLSLKVFENHKVLGIIMLIFTVALPTIVLFVAFSLLFRSV